MTEVAVHGPTGGPEFRDQGTDWHRRRDHETEHSLTLGGELDKLGSNIAIGRNIAGVHYWSDGVEGLRLLRLPYLQHGSNL